MFQEFKKFAMRGNVVDMAVGIIIGAAFGTIVKSLVDDVLMPPIGLLLGNVDFSDQYIALSGGDALPAGAPLAAAKDAGVVTLNWGLFINAVINFVIVAFAIFMVVKGMNKLKAKDELPPAPNEKECPRCCTKIPIKATRCPHCTSEVAVAA